MTTWLHFVGREYYSESSFIREAKAHGVTRRVSSIQLGCLAFGDRVLLAMKSGKSSVIFGCFFIERLSGLSPEAVELIRREFPCRLLDKGGRVVHRGCGSYIQGQTMAISASLEEIAKRLKSLEEPGNPMVGGRFFEHQKVRLKDITFFRGFRRFNYEKFKEALEEWKSRHQDRTPVIRGQFYVSGPSGGEEAAEGEVQEVRGYTKASA